MESQTWRRAKHLFELALRRTVADRDSFLSEAGGADGELRAEGESFLAASGDRTIASDAAASALSGRQLGVYRLRERIGIGGMGEVYRAHDTRLGRDVAIKILPLEFAARVDRLARFEREARVLASLNHPNIATIHGVEESDGVQALVMELVEGETLAERIARGPIAVASALNIGRQLGAALETAHDRGIVHRDLKPANLKITPDGTVKVLDFGIAKLDSLGALELPTQAPTITLDGTEQGLILGTAAYMSPEQARGQPVDRRTDIWGFGCVLYEMLTGHAAFARETRSDTVAAILEREPEWAALPRATPPTIQRMLRRCLEKDSRARVQHITVANDTIRQVLDHPESMPSVFSYARGRWKIAVVAGVAVLAGGVIALRTLPRADSPLPAPTAIPSITVLPPVNRQLTFVGDVGEAALSPDGRTFAYASAGRLLLQDVGGGASIEIARGGIRRLRWSPRGDQVAFVAVEGDRPLGIDVVSRLGGPSRRVTREVYYAWSPDGSRMAVAMQNSRGFRIIDVRHGGLLGSVALSRFQFLHDINWHRRLDRLALLERAVAGWVIWIVTPDGSEARPVYTDAQAISSICWSPIENIVYFLRSQNEAAELLALDVRDPASPTPRVVMSGLPSGGNLTISADGRSLLHVRSTQSSNLARLDLTRSSSSLEFITSGTRTFSTPQVSPDGQWIAAVVGVPPRTRLVKVPISGGEPIPLTSGDNFDGAPAWSPDGTTIAFASAKAGTSAVWLIRPDGMLPYQVNDSAPSSNMLASWTPDGRLMWQVLSSGNQMNYRIRDLSSGDDSMLLSGETYGYVFLPEFSPSGKEVAVAWNRRGGPSGLYVLTWPGLIPRFRSDPYFRPVGWSADGTSIVATAEGSVWLVSMKNGQRRRLAPVSVAIGDVGGVELEAGGDVTPDGRYFVGSVTNRTADVWLIENFDPQAGVRN